MGPIILGIVVVGLCAFLVLAYAKGGEQPLRPIEKPVQLEPSRG